MKHLILLRHGDYDNNDHLSETGKRQYEGLALDIQKVTDNASTYIMASPAERVVEGAEILAKKLRIVSPVEKLVFLWDAIGVPSKWEGKKVGWYDLYHCLSQDEGDPNPGDEKLEKMVEERESRADCLIIASHKDLTAQFSSYCLQKYFNRRVGFSFDYGQGVYLDLEKRESPGFMFVPLVED